MVNGNEIENELIHRGIDCENVDHFPESIINCFLNGVVLPFRVDQRVGFDQGVRISFPVLKDSNPLLEFIETDSTDVLQGHQHL